MAIAVFLPLALASCASLTDAKQLFVIAGQSNAEGYAMLDGLKKLVATLPRSYDNEQLPQSIRNAARQAIAESQGLECDSAWSTTSTADKTIDELRASTVDWRSFADASYSHPTAKIRAAHYTHAGVTLRSKTNGSDVDNENCMAGTSETTRYGPLLSRYNAPHSVDTFMPLAAGFGGHSPLASAFGLEERMLTYGTELAFGAELAKVVPETLLLKVAMGHSTLGDHWRIDGPLYKQLVQQTMDALQSQQASLGGLVWFQGFSDQWQDVWCQNLSAQYESNLHMFIRQVRADVGTDLPVVVVQARNGGRFQYTDAPHLRVIQQAQEAVSTSLPNVSLVPSADLSDCFHYDSGSQVVIGERAAKAMLELLNRPRVTSPIFTTTASMEQTTYTTLSTTRLAYVSGPALKSAQISLSNPAPSSTKTTTTTSASVDGVLPTTETNPRPSGAAEVPGLVAVGARTAARTVCGTMTLRVSGGAETFEQDTGVKPMLEQSIATMAGAAKDEVTVVLGARRLNSRRLRGWMHSLNGSLASSSQVLANFEIKLADEKLSEETNQAVFVSMNVESANAVVAAQSEAAGLSKYQATVMNITLAQAGLAAIVATSRTTTIEHDQLKGDFVATSSTTTTKIDEWKGDLDYGSRHASALLASLLGIVSTRM
eukprot:TRINITY_DN59710_c0_g1_i1.p1 TRINITY_DN59710_c0_g1~~TRINITY_DN59710_c0_g1_i1.p1  ORF type:complete len:657 (+),score=114.49 TRINITY_DN59710_c0_g1_i1:75-2045(+)